MQGLGGGSDGKMSHRESNQWGGEGAGDSQEPQISLRFALESSSCCAEGENVPSDPLHHSCRALARSGWLGPLPTTQTAGSVQRREFPLPASLLPHPLPSTEHAPSKVGGWTRESGKNSGGSRLSCSQEGRLGQAADAVLPMLLRPLSQPRNNVLTSPSLWGHRL